MSSFEHHKNLHQLIIRNVKSIIRNMIFFVIKNVHCFLWSKRRNQKYLEQISVKKIWSFEGLSVFCYAQLYLHSFSPTVKQFWVHSGRRCSPNCNGFSSLCNGELSLRCHVALATRARSWGCWQFGGCPLQTGCHKDQPLSTRPQDWTNPPGIRAGSQGYKEGKFQTPNLQILKFSNIVSNYKYSN